MLMFRKRSVKSIVDHSDIGNKNNYVQALSIVCIYKKSIKKHPVEFLDLREHGVEPSEKDGLHFDLDTQVKISNIFAERIKEILE